MPNNKLCLEENDAWRNGFVLERKNMQDRDCFLGQDVIDSDTAHNEFVHIFIEWIDGKDGAVVSVVDSDDEEVLWLMRVGGSDDVIGVVGNPLFFYLGLQYYSFALLFLHLYNISSWRSTTYKKLCTWPSTGDGTSPSSSNSMTASIQIHHLRRSGRSPYPSHGNHLHYQHPLSYSASHQNKSHESSVFYRKEEQFAGDGDRRRRKQCQWITYV